MASRTKTVEFAFPSVTTTLATATRRDLTAITLYLPENTSRTFRSVHVEANFRGDETSAGSITATLVGIKLGAAAFSDTTNTVTWTNTGDPQSHTVRIDVTSYFTSNFGAGTSQTCQVGMTITGIASANHTAKVVITYSYSDADNTRVKTVRIPLESGTALLTNTLASIGSNQIPNLNSFLPESSKTYRQIWFEVLYNEAGNAVTDFSLEVALDAEAGVDIARCEQALNGAPFGVSRWVRNDMTTNATHDFKARSDATTSRFSITVILCVTYEYSWSGSSTILNSLVIPFGTARMDFASSASSDAESFAIDLWIEEPTTITLAQSGFYVTLQNATTPTLVLFAGSQADTGRTFTLTAGSVQAGDTTACLRIDSGSALGAAITLARGKNTIVLRAYGTVAHGLSGVLLLNYTSGKASDEGMHNHSTCFMTFANNNSLSTIRNAGVAYAPLIEESNYFLNHIGFHLIATVGGDATGGLVVQLERASGEGPDSGQGWINAVGPMLYITDGELIQTHMHGHVVDQFYRWASDPAAPTRMNPETTREFYYGSTTTSVASCVCWITHHAITWSVAGDITGSAGGTVQIGAHRVTGEKIVSTSRSGNGAFSMTWYDNTESLFVEARESGALVGRSDNTTAA